MPKPRKSCMIFHNWSFWYRELDTVKQNDECATAPATGMQRRCRRCGAIETVKE